MRSMKNKMWESLKKEIRDHPAELMMYFIGMICIISSYFIDTDFQELRDMFYALVLIIGAFGCFILFYLFRINRRMLDVLEELQHEKAAEEQPDDD